MDGDIAARVREIWATPGMDDPAWVDQQLRDRRQVPFLDGQELDPGNPVQLAAIANVQRWAILGGHSGAAGDVITAAQVNKGRLVSAILGAKR